MDKPTLVQFLEGQGRFTGEIINDPRFDYLYCRFWKDTGVFTIANMTAKRPGQGSFTALLNFLEKRKDISKVVIESTFPGRFPKKLEELGFSKATHGGNNVTTNYERETRANSTK